MQLKIRNTLAVFSVEIGLGEFLSLWYNARR